MTVEATRRKRARYRDAGLRHCSLCQSEQPCWLSDKDVSPVSLICQRCGHVWVDLEETARAATAMWEREESERGGLQ